MKYTASRRNNNRFREKNSEWLKGIFKVPTLKTIAEESCSASNSDGCPNKPFCEKSLQSQRRESAALSAKCQHNPLRILMAGKHAATQSGEKDLCAILDEVLKIPIH